MARPKAAPKGSSPDDKILTIPHKDFMGYQDKISQALNVFHSMATTYRTFADSNMNAVTGTMNLVQSYTKQVTNANGVEESAASLEEHYPDLVKLFGLNKPTDNNLGAVFGEGMIANLPRPIVAADVKPIKAKRVKKPKDPNAPTRPVTAYFLYLEQNRDKIAKTLGSDASKGAIQNKGTEQWRALPEAEKDKYKSQYRANFEEFKGKMAAYKAQGGRVSSEDLEQADEDATHDTVAAAAEPVIIAPVAAAADSSDEDSDDEKAKTPTPPPKKKAAKGKKAAAAVVAAPAAPVVVEPAKEASPEKKKKSSKKSKEASPEESKKRKSTSAADGAEESKKKKRKSAATAGETEAEKPSAKKKKSKAGASSSTNPPKQMSGGSFGEDF